MVQWQCVRNEKSVLLTPKIRKWVKEVEVQKCRRIGKGKGILITNPSLFMYESLKWLSNRSYCHRKPTTAHHILKYRPTILYEVCCVRAKQYLLRAYDCECNTTRHQFLPVRIHTAVVYGKGKAKQLSIIKEGNTWQLLTDKLATLGAYFTPLPLSVLRFTGIFKAKAAQIRRNSKQTFGSPSIDWLRRPPTNRATAATFLTLEAF